MQIHFSRAGRKQQIVDVIYANPGISTYAIAKKIGMANSPHFRKLMRELAIDGLIIGNQDHKPNGAVRHSWTYGFPF